MGILYLPWTSQPQQAVGIDWSNPITRDLATCIDQNGLSLITSASVTKTGSFSTATTQKGLFLSNGADGVLSVSSGNVVAKSGSNFTVFGLVKTNSTGQTNKYIAIDKNTGLNKQTAIIYGYVANSIEFYTDNFTGTSPRTGSQLSIPDTKPHTFCYSYNGSAWKSYLDGSIVLNATRTFSLNTVPTDRFIFGSSTTADKVDVSVGLWLVFNRALSDAEIRSISQNPWQIFKPIPRRIFAPVAAGGGITAVTSDHNASYIITGSVAADASAAYAIRAAVASDMASSYAIRAAVTADATASYALRAAVASDLSSSYAIQSAGTVTTGLDAAYAVRGSVAGDISVGYQIAAAVQAEVAAAYAVRTAAHKDLAAGYSVSDSFTNVSSDIVCTYAINGVPPSYPSAESIAAAVLAALNAATIPVDVQKMNGAEVIGDGSESDPWRGVGVSP